MGFLVAAAVGLLAALVFIGLALVGGQQETNHLLRKIAKGQDTKPKHAPRVVVSVRARPE